MPECQSFMVKSHQMQDRGMQDRGMQIMHMHGLLDSTQPVFVRRAVHNARFAPPRTCHP